METVSKNHMENSQFIFLFLLHHFDTLDAHHALAEAENARCHASN